MSTEAVEQAETSVKQAGKIISHIYYASQKHCWVYYVRLHFSFCAFKILVWIIILIIAEAEQSINDAHDEIKFFGTK